LNTSIPLGDIASPGRSGTQTLIPVLRTSVRSGDRLDHFNDTCVRKVFQAELIEQLHGRFGAGIEHDLTQPGNPSQPRCRSGGEARERTVGPATMRAQVRLEQK
jgi:hypothetical protein